MNVHFKMQLHIVMCCEKELHFDDYLFPNSLSKNKLANIIPLVRTLITIIIFRNWRNIIKYTKKEAQESICQLYYSKQSNAYFISEF